MQQAGLNEILRYNQTLQQQSREVPRTKGTGTEETLKPYTLTQNAGAEDALQLDATKDTVAKDALQLHRTRDLNFSLSSKGATKDAIIKDAVTKDQGIADVLITAKALALC